MKSAESPPSLPKDESSASWASLAFIAALVALGVWSAVRHNNQH